MTQETFGNLPQPTTDLSLAKANLDDHGYCLLANALDSDTVAALRQRVEEQAAAERQLDVAYRDAGGPNQRLWFLVNKGQVFVDLLSHPEVRELVGHVLGEAYVLSSFTCNIANPGGIMEMHTDQWWMPPPALPEKTLIKPGSMTRQFRGHHFGETVTERPPMIQPAVACNVMWMLTDFTKENGATHVLPGSQQFGRQPDMERDTFDDWVPGLAPAGTAMIFEGRVWHSTGSNVSASSRIGALTYFCAPQFRQQENLVSGTKQEVLDNASQELLGLLGFKLWNGYGRIESPKAEWISRGETGLGELRPE